MAQSADQALVAMNITASDFQLLGAVAQCCSWLAQGNLWRKMKAIDIVTEMALFYENSAKNATESAPELAEHFGTTTDRAEYLINAVSEAGLSLPDTVVIIRDIMPAVGVWENNSDLFIGVFAILAILIIVSVGLRLYSRRAIYGSIRAFDWVIVASSTVTFVFGIVNGACLAGPTHLRGVWLRSWENYYVEQWSGKTTEVLYPTGLLLVKTSLLLFYWGLTTWWPLRASVVIVFVITFGNTLAMILTAFLRCKPYVAYEGYDFFTMTCDLDLYTKGEIITSSINIATDILIWLIPLPMVWKITTGMSERLLAFLTFGVGAFACIACGMRFSQVQEYQAASIIPRDQSRWLLWALTEMSLAIICSCVPAIRALIIKRAPSLIGSTVISDEKESQSNLSKDNLSNDKSSDSEKGISVNTVPL